MASVRVGVGLGVAVGTSGAVGSTWQASRSRAPSSPSEKHGWRVLGGMMGPVQ